jgi:hypothetical protein
VVLRAFLRTDFFFALVLRLLATVLVLLADAFPGGTFTGAVGTAGAASAGSGASWPVQNNASRRAVLFLAKYLSCHEGEVERPENACFCDVFFKVNRQR